MSLFLFPHIEKKFMEGFSVPGSEICAGKWSWLAFYFHILNDCNKELLHVKCIVVALMMIFAIAVKTLKQIGVFLLDVLFWTHYKFEMGLSLIFDGKLFNVGSMFALGYRSWRKMPQRELVWHFKIIVMVSVFLCFCFEIAYFIWRENHLCAAALLQDAKACLPSLGECLPQENILCKHGIWKCQD